MKLLKLFTLAILGIFISCGPDENVNPISENDISFDNIEENSTVWNEVVIEIKTTKKLNQVTFYLDDVLLQTVNYSPYKINLNTQSFADGTHTLKIEAFSSETQSIAKEISFNIKNTLLKVKPSFRAYTAYFSKELIKTYLMITKKTGGLISYQEANTGEELIFKRPLDFNEDIFDVHFINILENDGFSVETFADMKSSVWDSPPAAHSSTTKSVSLTVENGQPDQFIMLNSINAGFGKAINSSPTTIKLYNVDKYENVIAYLTSGEVTSYYVIPFQNTQDTVDISDFSTDYDDISISLPLNSKLSSFYIQSNYKDSSYTSISERPYSPNETGYLSLDNVLIPKYDQQISNFDLSIDYQWNDSYQSYFRRSTSDLPETIVAYDAEVNNINLTDPSNVQFNVNGDFDAFKTVFANSEIINQDFDFKYYYWIYTGANSEERITFPDIPSEISSLYPYIKKENLISENSVSTIRLIDQENISSYDELINQYFGENRRLSITQREVSFIGKSSSGRESDRDEDLAFNKIRSSRFQ